jgi:hypothetical protein
VKGRSSLEEDKDGKVICEQIVPFEEAAAAGGAPIFKNRYGGRGNAGGAGRNASNPSAPGTGQGRKFSAAAGGGSAEAAGQAKMTALPSGLWIQFEDGESYQAREQELLELLADSDGNDDVVIFLKSTKNFKILPANRRVRADGELQMRLGKVFGEKNIKFR